MINKINKSNKNVAGGIPKTGGLTKKTPKVEIKKDINEVKTKTQKSPSLNMKKAAINKGIKNKTVSPLMGMK